MFRIYWLSRMAGLIATTLPLFGALVGFGVVIGLERGSLILGGLIGAVVARIFGLIMDRWLTARAIAADEAQRRQMQNDREREYRRKLQEAQARGDFDHWQKEAQE